MCNAIPEGMAYKLINELYPFPEYNKELIYESAPYTCDCCDAVMKYLVGVKITKNRNLVVYIPIEAELGVCTLCGYELPKDYIEESIND